MAFIPWRCLTKEVTLFSTYRSRAELKAGEKQDLSHQDSKGQIGMDMIALVADGADRPGRRQKGTWIKRYSKKHKRIYEISASILIDFWSFIWRGVIRVSFEQSFHQDGVVPNWFPWYSAAILKAAERLICTLTSSANDLWQNINKGLDPEWCCTVKDVRSAPRRKYTALCTIWPTLCHGVSGFILLAFACIRN